MDTRYAMAVSALFQESAKATTVARTEVLLPDGTWTATPLEWNKAKRLSDLIWGGLTTGYRARLIGADGEVCAKHGA